MTVDTAPEFLKLAQSGFTHVRCELSDSDGGVVLLVLADHPEHGQGNGWVIYGTDYTSDEVWDPDGERFESFDALLKAWNNHVEAEYDRRVERQMEEPTSAREVFSGVGEHDL